MVSRSRRGAIALVLVALIAHAPPGARNPVFMARMAVFQLGTLLFARVITRLAMRKQIEPRLIELENLRAHFVDRTDSP